LANLLGRRMIEHRMRNPNYFEGVACKVVFKSRRQKVERKREIEMP